MKVIRRSLKSHYWNSPSTTLQKVNKIDILQPTILCELECKPEAVKVKAPQLHDKSHALKRMILILSDYVGSLYFKIVPKKGSPEHVILKEKAGFLYQILLGEVMYAYDLSC